MYDGVDYLIPICYPRFGPTDGSYGKYRAMTEQAMDASSALLKSSNQNIPMLPLITVYIANGNSNHNEEWCRSFDPDLSHTWDVQFDVFAEKRVQRVAIWLPNNVDNPLVMPVPNPDNWGLTDYVSQLR
jgi:hypothetical protein